VKSRPWAVRFSIAATVAASLLMGASGYYAVSSLVQRHESADQFHKAQLMPYVVRPPAQSATPKSAG
jgi:hypothetical protein